jgi:hypothetical protein
MKRTGLKEWVTSNEWALDLGGIFVSVVFGATVAYLAESEVPWIRSFATAMAAAAFPVWALTLVRSYLKYEQFDTILLISSFNNERRTSHPKIRGFLSLRTEIFVERFARLVDPRKGIPVSEGADDVFVEARDVLSNVETVFKARRYRATMVGKVSETKRIWDSTNLLPALQQFGGQHSRILIMSVSDFREDVPYVDELISVHSKHNWELGLVVYEDGMTMASAFEMLSSRCGTTWGVRDFLDFGLINYGHRKPDDEAYLFSSFTRGGSQLLVFIPEVPGRDNVVKDYSDWFDKCWSVLKSAPVQESARTVLNDINSNSNSFGGIRNYVLKSRSGDMLT